MRSESNKLKADNSGVNIRERKENAATADQQSNDTRDVELIARIRRRILDDESLSLYAHNVKIISNPEN